MYGFLRPILGYSKLYDNSNSYRKSYCGQCAALQQQFGYSSRATVSYDTTLIGLLIAGQTSTPQTETTAWCAIAPRKVPVFNPNSSAQQIASALSMLMLYAKLQDSVQENTASFWKKSLLKMYRRKFERARQTLNEAGFPSDAMDRLLAKQATIEQRQRGRLQDYAEPSAIFSGEMFRFTAQITQHHENEDILYQIGYHIGRIVYLTDSCVDLADDQEKQQFNALLAAHLDGEHLQIQARQCVVALVQESLAVLREQLGQLQLFHHQALIAEIILQGFPMQLRREIERSFKTLQQKKLFVSDYLPHAALASALCLFTNEANAAGWVWGNQIDDLKAYGFACSSFFDNGIEKPVLVCDLLCNPFAVAVPRKDCVWVWNIPKWATTAIFLDLCGETQHETRQEAEQFKQMQTIFTSAFAIATVIIILWLPVQLVHSVYSSYQENQTQAEQQRIQTEKEHKLQQVQKQARNETQSFIKKVTPELFSKITDVNKMLVQADNEINRLTEIKNKFSRQAELVQPRLQSWQQTKTKLLEIQKQIELQTERAFVVYQVNQGSKDFEQVAQGLVKQADEALNMAKQIESAIQETIPK